MNFIKWILWFLICFLLLSAVSAALISAGILNIAPEGKAFSTLNNIFMVVSIIVASGVCNFTSNRKKDKK